MGRQKSQVHTTVTLCHLLVKRLWTPSLGVLLNSSAEERLFFLCLQEVRCGDVQAARLL